MNINELIEKHATLSLDNQRTADTKFRQFAVELMEMVRNEGQTLWITTKTSSTADGISRSVYKALEELRK